MPATRRLDPATPATTSGEDPSDRRARRRGPTLSRTLRNFLLPAVAATPGAILLSPQGSSAPAQLLALLSAVALAVAFCAAAWIVSSPGGRPVFRLLQHASPAALSGWFTWQCVQVRALVPRARADGAALGSR